MAFVYNKIILDNQRGTEAIIEATDDKLSFSGVDDRYEFDQDVYAKNVKLANQTDIDILQNEIDSILPLSNYAYINGDDETSLLGGIPFGTGSINTLIQSPDLLYDAVNKVVKVDNINLATQTQIDILQTEIDTLNTNSLVSDTPLVIPTAGSVFISDGLTSTGTNASDFITVGEFSVDVSQILKCNDGLSIGSTALSISPTTMNAGPEYFIINNEQATRTVFSSSSSYDFDNTVKIGSLGGSRQLFLNGIEITPSSSSVTAGMLRALNINQIVPTVAQTFNVVWTSLSPAEQLAWKGGDAATIDPVASATGNYWNFTKSAPSTNKINWTPPIDLSALTFQDMQSVCAIVRFNNGTNVSTEGSLWFQIQSQNIVPDPPLYRTRWNYSNPATPVNQFQYFYKIHALDTITTTTVANFGKGQEVGQTKFKGNPCDVESNLWSIGLNKLVLSPTGDTSAGYTLAPIQSVGLNTASNINTYNFDVVAIIINNYRWNLFYA